MSAKASRTPLARLLGRGRPDSLAALFHGPDEGGVAHEVTRLRAAMSADADVVTVSDGELRDDRGALAGAAGSRSLFGGETLVVHPVEDPTRSAAALAALLTLEGEPNPVVVTAGVLTPKSKLLALAKEDGRVHAQEFRSPDPAAMARLAASEAAALGLTLDAHAIDRLLADVGTDRRLLAMELEKLALFLDAAPDRPAPATVADVGAVVAGGVADTDAYQAADWLLTGDARALSDWLRDASATEVGGVASALARRGAQMVAVAGRSGDTGALRRAGAFGGAPAVLARLDRRLSPPQLAQLAGALGELEALTRTSRADAGTELRQRMVRLAERLSAPG